MNAGVGDDLAPATSEPLTSRNIPVWVNIRHNNLTAVARHQADYVLGHISYVNNTGVSGAGRYRIGRESVRCTAVKCEDFFLYYIPTRADVSNLPPRVLQAMSAAYSAVDGYDYSDFSGFRYLRRAFGTDRSTIERRVHVAGPREGEFERASVTSEHHTHYRPEEIWKVLTGRGFLVKAAMVVLDNLRHISGVTEAVVSTFLCYIMYARPQVAYLVATSSTIWSGTKDVATLVARLKQVSTPLKSLQRYDILDLSQLFELQVLVNRGIGSIDWAKERENREKPDVVKCDPRLVYEAARGVFKMGRRHGYKYSKMDVDKYVKSRWEWVPTGSVHSQYPKDHDYIVKDYRHRSKFVTLNSMSSKHIKAMFARQPEMHAWASVKHEWAKQRAIYGVDLTSSVITNYAMYRCEESLKHRFPVGEDAEAGRVHARLKMMLQGAESFCYDFDDFNAQHSIESMQAVLMAYYDEFKGNMTEDQDRAMQWVIHSAADMTIHCNEAKRNDVYRANGTMLSGWRLTTFMNSVLNYVYFVVSGALDTSGVVDSVHNGDDVLLSVRSLKTVLSIDRKMSAINARSQPTKCNVFSIGEFLRVEHKVDKTDGLGAQYLTRAAATMVHSRVESQAPLRVTEALKAYVTRAEEITARADDGEDVSASLLDISVVRLAQIFNVNQDTLRQMIQAHALVGGCIAGAEGRIDNKYEEEIVMSERDEAMARKLGQATVSDLEPGIYDYTQQLSKQYEGLMDPERIHKAVSRATHRQLAVTRGTRLIVKDVRHEVRYGFGRALYKMYRGIIDIPYLEKAKFVGIPPIALLGVQAASKIRKLICDVADPEYVLSVYL